MTNYSEFLASKARRVEPLGRTVALDEIHPMLHTWQAGIVRWAVKTGRAAVWADTGLGKSLMQLEWARLSAGEGRALIVAPLAVCHQTIREAAKVGIALTYVRDDSEAQNAPGMAITNFERVGAIHPGRYTAVALDEASILKQADGKLRTLLITHFADVPRRLACTATPAPNEPEELTSQAEFLGVSTRANMLAAYFVHDDEGWRPKGHARGPMYRWMSSWAVALRRPSDMGFPDDGYVLPGLEIRSHLLPVDVVPEGQLFATELGGVGGRSAIRKATLTARCERTAELVAAESDQPWLLWCGMNAEADQLARLIPGAVNIHGGLTAEEKAAGLLGFANGDIQILVTKPSLAAFGLNFQRCAHMAFVGLSDSYEAYYQAIRRCYRYGQNRIVHAHVVLSELEGQIAVNIGRKERDATRITAELVAAMRDSRIDNRKCA